MTTCRDSSHRTLSSDSRTLSVGVSDRQMNETKATVQIVG